MLNIDIDEFLPNETLMWISQQLERVNIDLKIYKELVIAGELEGSWRAGGQQEGLQYNGEAA